MVAEGENFLVVDAHKSSFSSEPQVLDGAKARKALDEPPVVAICGGSCSGYTRHSFVLEVADAIEAKLGPMERHTMELQGYTEPELTGHGQGSFVVTIRGADRGGPFVRFTVAFGVEGEFAPFHREWCDDGDWSVAGDAQVAYMGSWDEAWLLICLLGQRLGVQGVVLRYGC